MGTMTVAAPAAKGAPTKAAAKPFKPNTSNILHVKKAAAAAAAASAVAVAGAAVGAAEGGPNDGAVSAGGEPDGDAEDNRTYCFCDGVSYGEMIGCDDEDCEREWVRRLLTLCPSYLR